MNTYDPGLIGMMRSDSQQPNCPDLNDLDEVDDSIRERSRLADKEINLIYTMLWFLYRTGSAKFGVVKTIMIPIEANVYYKYGFKI